MKSIIFGYCLLMPFLVIGQTDSIHFQRGMRWEDIVQLAQSENKYIFVDCFATWCGPCKEMDLHVYNNPTVVKYMNEHFISLKLQVDSAKGDAEDVRLLYGLAKDFRHRYHVKALPTFLFFSPNGEALHKAIGLKSDSDFISTAANSMNPERQYYTLIRKFQAGDLPAARVMKLATGAKEREDDSLAQTIARYYMDKYWKSDINDSSNSKESLNFIFTYALEILSSQDKFFHFLYDHGQRVDSVISRERFSHWMVCKIIRKEMVTPKMTEAAGKEGVMPDWNELTKAITKKYNKNYSAELVIGAQIEWYKGKKEYANVAKYVMKKYEVVGLDTSYAGKWNLNNDLFTYIFKYFTDKTALQKAAGWMKVVVDSDPDPDYLDTYANLLYKAGATSDALTWESKATQLKPNDRELQGNYDKMKAGAPTW